MVTSSDISVKMPLPEAPVARVTTTFTPTSAATWVIWSTNVMELLRTIRLPRG